MLLRCTHITDDFQSGLFTVGNYYRAVRTTGGYLVTDGLGHMRFVAHVEMKFLVGQVPAPKYCPEKPLFAYFDMGV